jgi:hypothetical protein
VGLLANGVVPGSDQPLKVLPSRDPKQLTRILEALAAVTGFATSSIDRMLTTESPRLPWGATLLLVTATVYDDLLAALCRLRDAGRRLVLLSLSADCPDLTDQGIRTYVLSGETGADFCPPARRAPPGTLQVEPVAGGSSVSPWARPATAEDGS